MKKKRKCKTLSILFCLCVGILFFAAGNVMQVNAYIRPDEIEEIVEEAKQYENNIVLDALSLKSWEFLPGDTVDTNIKEDAPLGEFDPDVIKLYTNREISVEVEYGLGDMWDRRREVGEDGRQGFMIQYVKIYEEGELIRVCAYAWDSKYWIEDVQYGF